MNEVQVFSSPEFGEIRTVMVNEKPLFVVNDVCTALGYSNPRKAVTCHCDAKDVAKRDTLNKCGMQPMTYVNENGLFALIRGARPALAQRFKRWITSDILPSMRKTEAEEILLNPDTIIMLATNLKEEQQRRIIAECKVAFLEAVTIENAPKVIFATAVEESNHSCLIGDLARLLHRNGIEINQRGLFKWLWENNYIHTKEGRYTPTPKAMELGVLEVNRRTVNHPDGSNSEIWTIKITGRGQIYFVNKFLRFK